MKNKETTSKLSKQRLNRTKKMSTNNELLQQKYNNYQATINEITSKVNQLRGDQEEHKIVLNTLQNTPKERRCFRMVGNALVEKTVDDAVPVLTLKLQNITKTITNLEKELNSTVDEFEKWKVEKKIKIIRK